MKTAPDTKFRTSYLSASTCGTEIASEESSREACKIIPDTEYKYSRTMKSFLSLCHVCIWSDSNEADLLPDDPFPSTALPDGSVLSAGISDSS